MSLASLKDAGLAALLEQHGLDSATAAEKAALFNESADVLIAAGHDAGTVAKAFFVPGRIEVMGKHTDYAGGRSLLAATNKAFCVVTVDRDDAQCHFFSTAKVIRRQRTTPSRCHSATADHFTTCHLSTTT